MKTVIRAPPKRRDLVSNLHHSGPNIIKKLNLGYRLHSTRGHAQGSAGDACLGDWRIEAAAATKLHLEARGRFEDAALALHFCKILLAAAIGNIFAEDDHVGIAAHLLGQSTVDLVHHGAWLAFRMGGTGEDI